jgi:NADH dehydrogenase
MKLIVRRVLIGSVCGMVSSLFLCLAVRNIGLGLSLGALLGIAQIFAFFDLESGSAIDRAMTCAALGLPFWATINVILLPLVAGQQPQWTAEKMRGLFPALICWLLFSFFLGILAQAVRELAKYFLGAESPARAIFRPEKATQVVILGGGFAGVTTAEQLEKQFRGDPTVSFTMISEKNSGCSRRCLLKLPRAAWIPPILLLPCEQALNGPACCAAGLRASISNAGKFI